MAISQADILQFENRVSIRKSAEIVNEAKASGKQTAFLCHSHKDARLAKAVQGFMAEQGWDVYIDWDDPTMPERPNRVTAAKIQERIQSLDWFLFLATQNSMSSRWCPWEIGYADGTKPTDSILIIPTRDHRTSYGSEYLDLYRHFESAQGGGYGVFRPEGGGIMARALTPKR
jgi:hypothetical protein